MPNFTRQYSIEGDSIFGYKVKDPLGTVAGADKSASNSDEEKPKPSAIKQSAKGAPKRTLTDRWPWIRKGGGVGAGIGKPPTMAAPDPPVKAPVKPMSKRPVSTYVSPFEGLASPSTTAPPTVKPVPGRPAAAAKTATPQASSPKKVPDGLRSASPVVPDVGSGLDTGLKQIQAFIVLSVKVGLALYIVVALWFVLDALREALCVVCVPLRFSLVFVWAIVSSIGRAMGAVVGSMGGKIRVLGR